MLVRSCSRATTSLSFSNCNKRRGGHSNSEPIEVHMRYPRRIVNGPPMLECYMLGYLDSYMRHKPLLTSCAMERALAGN